ncbi:MAG TPA: hypothetical protein VFB21_23105, partial [Chthonomonadaceae bacterium]|nr:hypothetical protein [Chthonomonadaceae bacterium]
YQARLVLRFQAHLADLLDTHYEIEIEGRCGESQFARRERILFEAGRIVFHVADPQRWWPRGRGPAALYDVTVRLYRDGQEIDRRAFRHGIRTIELRRTSITDSFGKGEFCFVVNGEKLFVKGTNWVPADAYHSRDLERIPRMLALVEELDCNMIRCWGGNVYENDLFYDLCDEKGILIWQDFAMACALYPQDDVFCARLAEEAQKVVRRLRQHACLALWAGDNECDDAYLWSGLGDPDSNRLTREALPRVLQAEDPIRPYLPSSPYTDAEAQRAGAEFRSENHLWGPRDYFRSDFYRNALCHFASEIGYHGCPAPSSLRRFLSPDKLWPPQNEEWLLHSTSPVPGVDIYDYRVALVCNQVREMFGSVPETLEDFARLSQYVQAEAFKFFIEMFRTAKWRRTGLLWWNLIDGWPQISDAVVDYYFEKKLAFDYIKAVQAPLCLMLREPKAWRQELVACNDTREDISLTYRLYESGAAQVLAADSRVARGDSVTPLASIPHFAGDKRFYIIEWESERGSGVNHYLTGSPPFDAEQYRSWLDSLRAVRSRKETERLK